MHEQGAWFVTIFFLITLILFMFWTPLGLLGLVLTVWCFYFFRDPDRFTPTRKSLVTSPADGILQSIVKSNGPQELGLEKQTFLKLSIFMSVFDCHVNRMPISGYVKELVYVPGKFLNATLDKASEYNERNCFLIKTEHESNFALIQIAGLIARRIICEVKKDQHLDTGERVGMIRFGSRVDLYLPEGLDTMVAVGQKMIAGETVIADTESLNGPYEAEIR